MNAARFKRWLQGLPTHVILIVIGLVWLLPTVGLLVTSFRPFQDVNETGWWTVLSAPKGEKEYMTSCGACHGNDGRSISTADLTNPELVQNYRRSFALLVSLKRETFGGQPHMGMLSVPDEYTAATIAAYLRRISGI